MFNKLANENFYRKFYFQDSFYAQCLDVNPLTMEQFDRSLENVRKLMDLPIMKTANHVLATGCGDSNIAAFACREAFAHYLPDVDFEPVEAIELSRHYEFPEDCSHSMALFISVSGGVFRTIEALRRCKRRNVCTVAITDSPASKTAQEADIGFFENSPEGDNNAGLRTYYVNVISTMILAAAMAEARTCKPHLAQLREQVAKYHNAFFARWEEIDTACFAAAVHFLDKKYLEVCGDGPMFWAGKFIQAKVMELSGDPCTVIDSENYMHVNGMMYPAADIGEIVLVNTNDANVDRIVESTNAMLKSGREVLLMCDKTPDEIGVRGTVLYCPMPVPEKAWNFLASIYAYLPGSLFGGFRHTTLGEPMFRGGFDPTVFIPAYYAPIEVIES